MADKLRLLDVVESASAPMAAKLVHDKLRLMTDDGGYAVELINNTGFRTLKGTLVKASTLPGSFELAVEDTGEYIGVVYDSGVKPGQPCRVVTSGKARVLLKDFEEVNAGDHIQTSDVDGRGCLVEHPTPVSAWSDHAHVLEGASPGIDCRVLVLLSMSL